MAEFLRALLLLAVLLVLAPAPASADDAAIEHARIVLSEEGYVLDADFAFALNPKLIDALAHGVALHFVTELRIERPRWYWFDKRVAHRRIEYRLSYHAITRRYRLNIGSLHQSFDNLEEAVSTMRHIRNWFLAPPRAFALDVSHEAELRFFHDTSQLPKPFQLSAVANGEWDVDTGWLKWVFLPQAVIPEAEAETASPDTELPETEDLDMATPQ